ncbi:DNA-binding NtrC family response regulator [Sphingomonas zeicaulis]|uniref:response regulator n=1 Tax=Sphingomonas zeicaulis TaxID=1632740 RepID=UPI003D1D8F56
MTGQFPGGEPGMSNAITILTVLVVEDDVLVRMHGIDILEEAGFHVIEADNADDALTILNDGALVHLLFSDIDMPGSLDGLGLAQLVHIRWPLLPLLLTSGHHRLADDDTPKGAKFVRKPWSSDALLSHVRQLVAA